MKETRFVFIYKTRFYFWPDPVREAQHVKMAKSTQIKVVARFGGEST